MASGSSGRGSEHPVAGGVAVEDEQGGYSLEGKWKSTEAFGNTSLDWTQAVKNQSAKLVVTFKHQHDQRWLYTLTLIEETRDGATVDVTHKFRHVVAQDGTCEMRNDKQLIIDGDRSGIQWTYQLEEDDTLRIRLEGAKRFGRCKGVDVIYFQRLAAAS